MSVMVWFSNIDDFNPSELYNLPEKRKNPAAAKTSSPNFSYI